MSYDTSLMIDTGGPNPTEVEDVGNMTCNVYPMWTKALGFHIADLEGKLGGDCIEALEKAVSHIRHPDNAATYKAMNPENGWGDHDGAARYLENILAACRRHPKAFLHFSY